MKVLLIDYSNMMYRCCYVSQSEYEKELAVLELNVQPIRMIQIWKKIMFNEIMKYIELFNPDKLIFAQDGRDYWRKDVYSKYKEHRAKAREDSRIDFDFFFPEAEKFQKELQILLSNFYFLQINKIEGDDIMAILSRETFKNDEVIIVSVDKDLNQLMTNKNIRRYNPTSKDADKFSYVPYPKEELMSKILEGDDGDAVPNVFVLDEDRFPNPMTKRIGLGPKTAEKILKEEKFLESDYVIDKVQDRYKNLSSDTILEEVKKNYERNLKLISFDFIPFSIQETIINSYNNYEIKPMDYVKLNRFAMSIGERDFSGNFIKYKGLLDNIK